MRSESLRQLLPSFCGEAKAAKELSFVLAIIMIEVEQIALDFRFFGNGIFRAW